MIGHMNKGVEHILEMYIDKKTTDMSTNLVSRHLKKATSTTNSASFVLSAISSPIMCYISCACLSSVTVG